MTIRHTSLWLLRPFFRASVEEVLWQVRREGLPFRVWETLRDHRRQEQYYAQGRTAPGKIITKAPPGHSPHEWGVACDLVLDLPGVSPWSTTGDHAKLWEEMGAIAIDCGLIWGGSWRWRDLPHVEAKEWREHRPVGWETLVRYRLERIPGD